MLKILYSYIDKNKHNYLLHEKLVEMPLDFQQRVSRYKKWQNVQASIIGRLLLDNLIKTFDLNLSIEKLVYNSNQKPYFENTNIFFNVSHTEDIVVCVITDINEIGIDIEKLQNININNFKNFLTRHEWETLNNSQNAMDSFISLWTQKESVIKATGYGLSLNLASFEIENDNTTVIDNNIYSVKDIYINQKYKCHLAIKGDFLQTVDIELLNEYLKRLL
ncbi:4'-phosphopantetheinyl transferase superfamily protein [Chryseobacterium aahli]|uniref:4'-phosphopantetheinyl transferase family protein n=1 Tax=Chryseobacterium aahli TaxID=1278643 RepID=UPI001F618709|nr:4'-phosphopantetheinyl transferase superfamily protein [Chryseobacterium aahli]MCI3939185.1 4'-phosphopantetheinyl transferase superfamily protein [Chryseobacterium aahli]